MAKTFKSGDLLLINRNLVTYRSDYDNLVDSIKIDLFGDGTGTNPSVIALNDLKDVTVDSNAINDATTKWVLQYNQTTDLWEPTDPKEALDQAIALNHLTDVRTIDPNITAGVDGHDLSAKAGEGAVLAYDLSEGEYVPTKLKDVLGSLPNGEELELDDLVDVSGAAAATKSQVLVSDGAKNFSPKSLVDLLGELETDGKAIVLNDLGDVNNVSPGKGKVLLSDASNVYNPVDFRTEILNQDLKLEELVNVSEPTSPSIKVNSSVVTMVTTPATDTDGLTSASYEVRDIGSVINAHLNGGGTIDISPEDLTSFTGLFLKPNPAHVANDTEPKYLPDFAKTTNLTDDIILYVERSEVELNGLSAAEDAQIVDGWYYVPQTALTGGGSGVAGGIADDAGSDDAAAQAAGTPFNTGAVRIAQFRDTKITVNASGQEVIAAGSDVGSIPSNLHIEPTTGVLYAEIPNTLTFVNTVVVDSGDVPHFGSAAGPNAAAAPTASLGDFYVFVLETGATVPHANAWNGGGPDTLNVRNGDMVAYNGTEWVVIGTVNTDTVQQNLDQVTEVGARTNNAIHVLADGITQRIGTGFIAVDGLAPVTKADGSDVAAADGDLVAHVLKVGKIDFNMFPELQP